MNGRENKKVGRKMCVSFVCELRNEDESGMSLIKENDRVVGWLVVVILIPVVI